MRQFEYNQKSNRSTGWFFYFYNSQRQCITCNSSYYSTVYR